MQDSFDCWEAKAFVVERKGTFCRVEFGGLKLEAERKMRGKAPVQGSGIYRCVDALTLQKSRMFPIVPLRPNGMRNLLRCPSPPTIVDPKMLPTYCPNRFLVLFVIHTVLTGNT